MFGTHSNKGYKPILEGICIKTLVYGESTLMSEFQLTKGSALPSHSHPYEQTGYLVSGRIVLTIDGRKQTINPGDSWLIPINVPHQASIEEDSVALEIFSPARADYIQYVDEESITK